MRECLLDIDVLRSREAVRALWSQWDALCEASVGATPFQRPGWAIAWMDRMQVTSPLVVAVRCGRDLVGLLPAFGWDTPVQRNLAMLGAGVSDHLDAVAAAGFERAAFDALGSWLEGTGGQWGACAFDEVGPGALLQGLLQGAVTSRMLPAAYPQSVCPVLTVADGAIDVGHGVPSEQATRLRKARRRCERLGAVDFDRADRADFEPALQDLFDLHARRRRLRGGPGALGDPRVVALLEDAAADAARRGALRLYRMRIDSRPAAMVCGFRERRRVHLYMQGLEPALERASPGTAIVGFAIADALAEGIREIDFLRGCEPYKYDWGAVDEVNVRITVGWS